MDVWVLIHERGVYSDRSVEVAGVYATKELACTVASYLVAVGPGIDTNEPWKHPDYPGELEVWEWVYGYEARYVVKRFFLASQMVNT
jgi:hypothetical protein